MTQQTSWPRRYVDENFEAKDISAIEAVFDELLSRPVEEAADLEQWTRDCSEFSSCVAEESARRFVNHTCHTEDPEIKKLYMEWIESIQPLLRKKGFEMEKKLVSSPALDQLDPDEFSTMIRSTRNSVELFREENIPLQTDEEKLDAEYNETIGAMTVDFDGETRTLPYMGRILEETDRDRRESAFRKIWDRMLEDTDKIETIFDKQVALRAKMAENVGFSDYRELRFRQLERFDYTPADCADFHDSIEKVIVPLLAKRQQRRREKLGVSTLRPWDSAVDVEGRPPLRPFEEVDDLVSGCRTIFERIDPSLGSHFEVLVDGELLDLQSRKGKAPGGYQCNFQETRKPFIFMNAAGKQGDIETLLHEGGHAFHSIEARNHDLMANRDAPIEFCEVASMAMELLGVPHLDVFYENEEQVRRARIDHLEGVLSLFPWVGIIDSFQHWVYTNPGHSRQERKTAWLEIMERFGTGEIDWSGLEDIRAHRWMRQSHLFGVPFYYVEYAIAQLGALQVWRNYRNNPEEAVRVYREGLSLGNTRPLRELYEGAGIRFDFSRENLEELVGIVGDELKLLEGSTATG